MYQPFLQHKEIPSKHHDPYIFKYYDIIPSFLSFFTYFLLFVQPLIIILCLKFCCVDVLNNMFSPSSNSLIGSSSFNLQ